MVDSYTKMLLDGGNVEIIYEANTTDLSGVNISGENIQLETERNNLSLTESMVMDSSKDLMQLLKDLILQHTHLI